MPSMSDIIVDLGAKGANKLLAIPLKKAAAYYEVHIDLLNPHFPSSMTFSHLPLPVTCYISAC